MKLICEIKAVSDAYRTREECGWRAGNVQIGDEISKVIEISDSVVRDTLLVESIKKELIEFIQNLN